MVHHAVTINFNFVNHGMLFLSPDATAVGNAQFGARTGPIHLDNVQCVGFGDYLVNCTHDPDASDCGHHEDASIRCQGTCTEMHL